MKEVRLGAGHTLACQG